MSVYEREGEGEGRKGGRERERGREDGPQREKQQTLKVEKGPLPTTLQGSRTERL